MPIPTWDHQGWYLVRHLTSSRRSVWGLRFGGRWVCEALASGARQLWQAPGVADIEIGAAWLEGFEAATRIWRDFAQEHLIALDVHVDTQEIEPLGHSSGGFEHLTEAMRPGDLARYGDPVPMKHGLPMGR